MIRHYTDVRVTVQKIIYTVLYVIKIRKKLWLKAQLLHRNDTIAISKWHDWLQQQLVLFTARCTIVQSAVEFCDLNVVRLSVCPPVTLVDCDHMGWKSWKLIARTISPTPSLFIAHLFSGEHGEIFGETKMLTKKNLLSLTLVRLCGRDMRCTHK